MTRRWQDIKVSAGSLSSHRLPNALAPRRFQLRNDSLAESFCAAGRRLGASDVALAREAREASPWARLFQNEPAYLYAEILSFRAEDAGFSFAEALEQEPTEALHQILDLGRLIHGWMKRIQIDPADVFSKQLGQLEKAINFAGRTGKMNARGGFSTLLDKIVQSGPLALVGLAEQHHTVQRAFEDGNALTKARATRESLRSLHALLRNAVSSLQPAAQAAFDRRLECGEIDPGLALLLAELHAAAHVDAVINQLPDRHTTLYYSDIIGQHPATASPEMVLLDLGDVPKTGYLPQGARLDARLPDGTVQSFETDAGVPINPARISSVKMLSYQVNENISYHRALGGITGLRAATLNAKSTLLTGDTLFSSGKDEPIDIGLDVSTPMLSLAEGTRRIEISIHMNRGSSLPALSRALTDDEILERTERRLAEARPRRAPDLRRDIASIPVYSDPEVRLALAADPTLVAAFSSEKQAAAIEHLTEEITEFADLNDETTSVGLIYRFLMGKVEGPLQLRLLLGRIVTLCLIEQHPFPSGDYWDQIFALVDTYREDLIGKTPADPDNSDHEQNSMIFAAFSQRPDGTIDYPPEDVFQSLLGDAFDVTVTTDDGPRAPDIMQVSPIKRKRSDGGITLALRYDNSAPALTGPSQAPRLSLRYASDARLCPVSFFEAYTIETISIRTRVSGLRKLAAFSDDAPLVTDQTFQPFGPRPEEDATFQVGCAEMARKPVTEIGIRLAWSNMPNPVGGLESHYDSYGKGIEVPRPELSVDYLSGDGWKPVSIAPEPLFQSEAASGQLLNDWYFSGRVSGHSIPATGTVTAQEFQSRQSIRAGMVRLRLNGTAGGFHAEKYPLALVDAMRPRLVRVKRRKIPPAPFVPEIGEFILSYTAEATIELNAPETARPGEEVHQIGPFGSINLFPGRAIKQPRLFPKRLGYGQVFFQISGQNVTGPTALAVSLAPSGHLRRVPTSNPISWMYLTENGWQEMPESALSSDTTAGLTRSGIVVIDLPEDVARSSSLMPEGGVWISAVAQRPNLEVFPALSRVKTNGVWVRRRDEVWSDKSIARTWSFNPARPGLSEISEIPTPGLSRPPEPRETFVARVGERLRHRRRGVTPWDMERLVLEQFPEVWMAKCLPNLSQATPEPTPGHVTLVVASKPPVDEILQIPSPALFDVATLERIRAWLADYCSELVEFDVVNPTFERLQVRAKLTVSAHRENGAMVQMLRRDLARWLSVWTADDTMQRFGWSLNMNMLRAQINNLSYVNELTDFSILHLVGDDSKSYQLLDTAQSIRDIRGTYGPVLRPRFPWSLPLSTRDHILTIVPDLKDETPTAAGIGALSLGDMLVVGQRTKH